MHANRPGLITLALVLALGAVVCVASCPSARAAPAPEPTALPVARDAVSLHAALSMAERERLDGERRVVTFAAEEHESAAGHDLLTVSLGTLSLAPDTVRSVLARSAGYPGWVPLDPTYKAVRLSGPSRMTCSVGQPEARRGPERLVYDVSTDGSTTTWTIAHGASLVLPGSFVAFEIAAHPSNPGATLVVHRQLSRLPDRGGQGRTVPAANDHGRGRSWRDAKQHARRIHWAIDAAAREPEGAARRSLYLDHYHREFPASTPFWAN